MSARLDFDILRTSAVGHWPMILASLGIPSASLRNKHGPCPGCGGKDRFRFDDKQGRGTFICGQGGDPIAGDGFDLLNHVHGWTVKDAFLEVADVLGVQGTPRGERKPRRAPPPPAPSVLHQPTTAAYALAIWRRLEDQDADVASHPYARFKGIAWPAGAVRGPVSGSVVGQDADCLVIPIREIATFEVRAVQVINAQGKKQTLGSVSGRGFGCGNTLDRAIPWYVVEGWADAISAVFHIHRGNACAFAAFGGGKVQVTLAQAVVDAYGPNKLTIAKDAPPTEGHGS